MRNQSEQLPSCPQAHSYAAMVDLVLKDGAGHTQLGLLWFAIPDDVQLRISADIPDHMEHESIVQGDRRWRGEMARRIRAWYAP